MNDINWNVTNEDAAIISKIVDRARRMAIKYDVEYEATDISMDVTACHLNGTPLKLQALLDADDLWEGWRVLPSALRRHQCA
jgi:hypothetical protein